MPLIRRLPKRGFINAFKKEYRIVNLDQLNLFKEGSVVSPKELEEKGLIQGGASPVKILGGGELKKPLQVSAHHYSSRAREEIEKVGGQAQVIGSERDAASVR